MIRADRRFILIPILAIIPAAGACKSYQIEYRKRPAYYTTELVGDMPDRVQLDDGTIIVWETRGKEGKNYREAEREEFKPREKFDDGTVRLRAIMPEHVLANVLACLRNEEYRLIWDQMLSEQTKVGYESQGMGYEEFEQYFVKHRVELAKTFNRLLLGVPTKRTVIEGDGRNVIVCRFWPQIAQQFQFKKVYIIREDPGLKMLMVE